ncbi:MAG: Holliday junction resolvase-like protein [Dehalococcoidia bacterium]|jgi:predicted Holliday junction resolvase-like endonuclease
MQENKQAGQIIDMLKAGDFYAECPDCGDSVMLRDAHLFYLDDFNEKASETYEQYQLELKEMRAELKRRKANITAKSLIGAKAVNIGFILERIAPSLEDFPFCCNDCRSLFEPVDYVVFEGLADAGVVKKMLWVEIKTGSARLSQRERQIKLLVEDKKLEWDTYKEEKGDEK